MASASPICLMARATPIWHQRLSHLNFDTINDLEKNDLVFSLPKFKYAKEHLCPSCEQGKRKRASHPPNPVPNSKQQLHLLHMDLCGQMRVASINGKRVYNQRTKKIMETMNVMFDELSAMAFEQNSSKPGLQSLIFGQISSKLELTYASSTITSKRPSERDLDILFEPLHNEYLSGQPLEAPRTVHAAPVIQNLQVLSTSTSIQDSAPTPTNSSNTLISSHNVDEQSQPHAQQQGNQALLPTASAADDVPKCRVRGRFICQSFYHTFH
nr:retrovirus-related Pol polyprotein from transposon TNT 1-94 [Tanacetum cinerariifolium]